MSSITINNNCKVKKTPIYESTILLTIGRTVLKESDDLVILGVTFDSKMLFEKHPR